MARGGPYGGPLGEPVDSVQPVPRPDASTSAVRRPAVPRLRPVPPPPAHGPSEALFSKSEFLDPLPALPDPEGDRHGDGGECVRVPRPPAPAPPVPPPEIPVEMPPDTHVPQARLGLDNEEGLGGQPGTAVQLVSRGPQDYVLSINPQVTFFKAVWRRATPVAVECFADEFVARPGATLDVDLGRRGDLLGDVFVELDLPDLGLPGGTWADAAGYVLLNRVRFLIDDLVVDDQERLWTDVADRLFLQHGRRRGLDAMIGRGRVLRTDRAHALVVPLKLSSCAAHRARRQWLPIAALARNARLTVRLTFEAAAGCVTPPPGAAVPAFQIKGRVLGEQAFLGDDGRRAVMRTASELLVETVQDVDALGYSFDDNGVYPATSVGLDLSELNLPVKFLAFVAYDENGPERGRFFEYLPVIQTAGVLFSSRERFAPRDAPYFSLIQRYQHATRAAPDGVHVYSFALDAAARQPTGALNFAVLDRPILRVTLGDAGGRAVKVKCFAVCYNWLRFAEGAAAFRFV